jgi:phage portal protein BeeE
MNTTNNSKVTTKYVVKRDNHRVSDALWDSRSDAQTEFEYWRKIVNHINDGTNVTVQAIDIKDE